MYHKKLLALTAVFSGMAGADPINTNNGPEMTLDDIQIVATKKSINNFPRALAGNDESGNFIPPVTTSAPLDTAHTTPAELNNMAGISILGGNQTISQNISVGGQMEGNIIVGIDGINNYFTNFGGNSTRLLPSTYLFKQVTATQAGSDITYGSGNIGGAVNFTTLDPEDLLQGQKLTTLATLGGNTATTGANANAAIAARTGKVTYLLDIVGSNDNNMKLGNGSTLPYSANQNFQGLAKLGIDISNSQSLKISVLNMQNQGQYPARITNSAGPDNPPSNFNFNQSQAMLDYSYTPDNPYLNVKAKLSYQINKYSTSTISNDSGWYRDPQDVTLNTTSLSLQNTTKVVQQKLLYGVEYTNISGSDADNSTRILNFPTASQQIYGLFLQDSWEIIKPLTLTAGTRYNAYQSQAQGAASNAGAVFTNQLGLNYKFLPDWLAYIGYSEGFEAPTLTNLYYSGFHEYSVAKGYIYQPNPSLQPTLAHNKTIGIEYSSRLPANQHLAFSATAFLNNVSNYVVWTYVGKQGSTNLTQMSNIAATQLYGYTLALTYSSSWVKVDTNFTSTYGSTQSSYTNGKDGFVPAGAPLPIPQAKGFLGLTFPINSIDSTIGANMNYTLNQDRTPDTIVYDGSLASVAGYTLFGLAYTWTGKHHLKGMQAMLGIDNLLNTNYQNYNGFSLFPAMGRNIYAQVSYKY